MSAFCYFLLPRSDETNQVQCGGHVLRVLDYSKLLLLSFSFCSSFRLGVEQIAFLSLCVAALALVCLDKCGCCQGNVGHSPILCLGCIRAILGSCAHYAHYSLPSWARSGHFCHAFWGNKGSSKSQIIPLDHASKHAPWLGACLLIFSRAELLHLFPVCYRPVYLTVV